MGERSDTKQFMKKVRCARSVNVYKPFENRAYHEGRYCDQDYIRMTGLRQPFINAGCLPFAILPPEIYPRHIQEFYARYQFNSAKLTLNFQMYGHNYTWSLEKLGNVLGINSNGIMLYTDSTETREFKKYRNYHPSEMGRINTEDVQNTIDSILLLV